eukprot:TRINITY_DN843_c0_g1_i2.p1 TRINITY_DN843_c0_g1~~TRINITY_DN843_c0_g1_i2.p1  ORF type:complete len:269 (+),score=79.04 TRINITY_DN843_c0_g1_i2:79-807(+)
MAALSSGASLSHLLLRKGPAQPDSQAATLTRKQHHRPQRSSHGWTCANVTECDEHESGVQLQVPEETSTEEGSCCSSRRRRRPSSSKASVAALNHLDVPCRMVAGMAVSMMLLQGPILFPPPVEAVMLEVASPASSSSSASAFVAIDFPDLFPPASFLKEKRDSEQKRYQKLDDDFKASLLLEQLLKKSVENRERNQREIQAKYCAREAEWGVGDCSLVGLGEDEKAEFLAALEAELENFKK